MRLRSLRPSLRVGCQILVALAGVTLVMEIVLRVCGVSYPYFLRVDTDVGFSLNPNAAGWQEDEGSAYLQISSQGLHDREHAVAKPAGTYRIAVLGKSFTEAEQVPVEQTYAWKLQNDLASCGAVGGKNIETINFGVNSYSTAQQLALLRSKVWNFHPDLVLYLFIPTTDVRKNSKEIEKVNDRPYFFVKDGQLTEDDTFRDTGLFKTQTSLFGRVFHTLISYSRVLQVINERYRRRNAMDVPAPALDGATPQNEESTTDPAYAPPVTDAWRDAWSITERLLTQINTETRSHGARFVTFVGEAGYEVNFDDAVREAVLRAQRLSDFSYPASRLEAMGKNDGFPVIPLSAPLLAASKQSHLLLHGFTPADNGGGHWNADGHRVASTVMAESVCGLLGEKTR